MRAGIDENRRKLYTEHWKAARKSSSFPNSDMRGVPMASYYNEKSPSLTEYFSWINNTNEGSCEEQTLANLAFFEWLKKETGAQFDIYAFDAGNIDGAAGTYGSIYSDRFKAHFPNGFGPVAEKAKELEMKLGVWGGADGFGDTEESKKERRDMIVSLCRDFAFGLFKFDTVCGVLRSEYREYFTEMIEECRKYVPDLVILNHRNDLGGAQQYCTTKLWESAETYIDVLYSNKTTAPHHRGGTLMRGNPEGLERLVEDHGVCLSSCLDFWADELVIQAFRRGLILSPQIYGNPWLMREDELRTMGRLIAFKRSYRDILVDGITLSADRFGPNAVSRGNENIRFITMVNLSWEKAAYTFVPGEETGNAPGGVYVRAIHPYEEDMGFVAQGDSLTIEMEPWRTALVVLSKEPLADIGLQGGKMRPMTKMDADEFRANVYGLPGESYKIRLSGDHSKYTRAEVNGRDASELLSGKEYTLSFEGEKVSRGGVKLGVLKAAPVPANAEALYEAAVFAADNNSLEVRSLQRSGDTDVKAIAEARRHHFEQDTFVYRGIWDKFMFDGKPETFFMASVVEGDQRISGGMLRVDTAKVIEGDTVQITFLLENGESLSGLRAEACVSLDAFRPLELVSLSAPVAEKCKFVPKTVPEIIEIDVQRVTATFRLDGSARYFRIAGAPARVNDFTVCKDGAALCRCGWRASNLFSAYGMNPCHHFQTGEVRLESYPAGSKLCVALEGRHERDAAYVVLELADGTIVGAPDKAPSFPANQYEHFIARTGSNNTFYFPIKPEYENSAVKVHVLGLRNGFPGFHADVWVAEADTLPCVAELKLY